MALLSSTALLADVDHFDFAPTAKVIPHQELGPGKNFSLIKAGGVNHIVIKANYDSLKPNDHFVGTAKDDSITNKFAGVLTIVGGGGNDVVNSGNNVTQQFLYGDDVQAGFRIGNTYGKYGNDVLHLGARDVGKSGNGFDVYVLHGPFQIGPNGQVVPAKLYFNLAKDTLDMGGDAMVTAYEVAKYNVAKTAVLLKSFTLTGHDDFFGKNAARIINPEVERGFALEGSAPGMWVSLGDDDKLDIGDVQHQYDQWNAKWEIEL